MVPVADEIMVDYDELPVIADTERATDPSSPVIWEENGSNIAYDWELGDEAAVNDGFDKAHHVTTLRLINNRIVVNAMEPRAALGEYDASRDHYTLYTGCQGVHGLRNFIAGYSLGIDPKQLRVVSEDVGGGFGMKTFNYPEYPLVLFAAKQLGRPVKWVADRSDSFITDTQGRGGRPVLSR